MDLLIFLRSRLGWKDASDDGVDSIDKVLVKVCPICYQLFAKRVYSARLFGHA